MTATDFLLVYLSMTESHVLSVVRTLGSNANYTVALDRDWT